MELRKPYPKTESTQKRPRTWEWTQKAGKQRKHLVNFITFITEKQLH